MCCIISVARGALLAVRDARDMHMVEQLRDGSGAVEEVRLRAHSTGLCRKQTRTAMAEAHGVEHPEPDCRQVRR